MVIMINIIISIIIIVIIIIIIITDTYIVCVRGLGHH